jgi:hypothetical protein
MIRPLAVSLAAGLALLAPAMMCADETDAAVLNQQITVRILNGADGQPLAHLHLVLFAGYDQDDIRKQLWREETLTDEQGRARLSSQFAHLPWLQVSVTRRYLCQKNPDAASFSVELIRRDGLSAPNRCGIATVENTPGVFTLFVKSRPSDTTATSVAPAQEKPGSPAPAPTDKFASAPGLGMEEPPAPGTAPTAPSYQGMELCGCLPVCDEALMPW